MRPPETAIRGSFPGGMVDDLDEAAAYPAQWWPRPLPAIPDRPHMPELVAAWIEARLRDTNCFLEYGMGGSTRLAAALNVPQIVSVESDRNFARAVAQPLRKSESTSVLSIVHANIGPTRKWGYPMNFKAFRRWPNYALRAWEFVRKEGLSPDLVLIDGRFRVGCFLASLVEARPGTTIAFDDYLSRPRMYGTVERFLPPTQVIDRCAIFTVPAEVPLREIALALARYGSQPE